MEWRLALTTQYAHLKEDHFPSLVGRKNAQLQYAHVVCFQSAVECPCRERKAFVTPLRRFVLVSGGHSRCHNLHALGRSHSKL